MLETDSQAKAGWTKMTGLNARDNCCSTMGVNNQAGTHSVSRLQELLIKNIGQQQVAYLF